MTSAARLVRSRRPAPTIDPTDIPMRSYADAAAGICCLVIEAGKACRSGDAALAVTVIADCAAVLMETARAMRQLRPAPSP